MLHFSKKYTDATVLVLTDNYRSTQQILDLSSRVIGNNETRIVRHVPGISKTLFAKKSRE
jgi:DNA helicase-2/ATP-dependent DNA helicase PcrA